MKFKDGYFTIGTTPKGDSLLVFVEGFELQGAMAYDIQGFVYNWEDGFITWKSSKASLRYKNKYMSRINKLIN